MGTVGIRHDGPVTIVTIERPERRNAVDGPTAEALREAFEAFDRDEERRVAVLAGAGGTFCAGADLRALADGVPMVLDEDGPGPMGPTRLALSKPVVAAVEGHAVAGGLELALWCDLRVAAESATFGVYCRRWGVPLVDGGTVRLPRIVGHGRALDMVLTGRAVGAAEALAWGLASRVVPDGRALDEAVALAHELAALPQQCLRNDRASLHESWSLPAAEALRNEHRHGMATIATGETAAGAEAFSRARGGT
ncbi:MAG TPA: crotonase/enoyl-CoA hydratase family protein [Frankiaceae bacterium]|jgi:enoyl-CoA hydratase|nr:crotonase/enoyl-CoA hydratase family protein [Frankiaceae bacterium]